MTEVDCRGYENIKIGVFVDEWQNITGFRHPYVYYTSVIADSIDELGFDVQKVHDRERLDEFDLIILTQSWRYHGFKMGELFEEWLRGEFEIKPKTVVHLLHVKEKYSREILERPDGYWVPSSYVWNLPSPAWELKFRPWTEPVDESIKDDIIRAPLGRVGEDEERTRRQALLDCPLDIKLYGKSRGSNDSYSMNVDFPENIKYSGGFESSLDLFAKSKFIFEAERDVWKMPPDNPVPYWSDRIAFAVSHGAHLITNYQPALDMWESTISYDYAYNNKLEYDRDAILRDRQRWHLKKRLGNVLNATIYSLLVDDEQRIPSQRDFHTGQ